MVFGIHVVPNPAAVVALEKGGEPKVDDDDDFIAAAAAAPNTLFVVLFTLLFVVALLFVLILVLVFSLEGDLEKFWSCGLTLRPFVFVELNLLFLFVVFICEVP